MARVEFAEGEHGHAALYDYHPDTDVVLVLEVKAQREAGYGDE